jgi:hypothetical protein
MVAFRDVKHCSFGVVCFDVDGLAFSSYGHLPLECSLRRVSAYALNSALIFAHEVVGSSSDKIFEFFVPTSPFFSYPYRRLHDMEIKNFSLLVSIQSLSTVFTGLRSESDGFKAAVLLTRQMPVNLTFPNFHSVAKARSQITQSLSSECDEEWLSSAPTCTKLLFPDVASAHVIGALDLKTWVVQIITGHCALNAHQYRFGFLADPACRCDDQSESVEHFLFVCPLYDRAGFKTQSLAELSQWPPPLHSIFLRVLSCGLNSRVLFLEAKGFFLAVLTLGHLSL